MTNEPHEAEVRFAERLKAVRVARNWSAQELARRTGMTRVAISKIENRGRGISLGEALDLAQVLGMSIEDMTRPGHLEVSSTIAFEVTP